VAVAKSSADLPAREARTRSLQSLCIGCNVCIATGTNVYVRFCVRMGPARALLAQMIKCLGEVGPKVIDMLDPNRQPYQTFRNR
jgi:hypothetical protein